MKSSTVFALAGLVILLAGCQKNTALSAVPQTLSQPEVATASATMTPTHPATLTPLPASPTPNTIATPTPTTTIPAEVRLKTQCLKIEPTLPSTITSSGVVILASRVDLGGRYKRETYLRDMMTGETVTITNGGGFTVSLDKTLAAYGSVILEDQDRILKHDLIIADAYGKSLKIIPWKKEWLTRVDWVDNQRLVLTRHESNETLFSPWSPNTLIVLDPFTGGQSLLLPNFPKFVAVLPRTMALPNWDGWFNVMYSPALTHAVYPQFIGENDEQITYALWDLSKQQLVASLENIFAVPSEDNGDYPKPQWSPDGSQFVFRGLVDRSEQLTEFELYRVSWDGQIEQLTHLTSIALVQESNLSWSPDGRYIAMFLNNWLGYEPQARVAVLDTVDGEITDYCISVTYAGKGYGGGEPPMAIWSPDGRQFLVVDWYTEDHQRVILVDLAQGIAANVGEDVEPMGWMVKQK